MLNTRHSKKGHTPATAPQVLRPLTPWHHIKMSCHVFTSSKCTRFKVAVSKHKALEKRQTTSTTQHVMWQLTHWPHIKMSCHVMQSKNVQVSQTSMANANWVYCTVNVPLSCIWHGNSHSVFTKLVATWKAYLWQLTRLIRKLVAISDDSCWKCHGCHYPTLWTATT